MAARSRIESILSTIISVHPHETSGLIHSSSCFFFILSAYFIILPLRDEAAISLGVTNLPGLFIGSLALTLVAAPFSTVIFSFPNLSKGKALALIHRFFSVSILLFFILWYTSSPGCSASTAELSISHSLAKEDRQAEDDQTPDHSRGWDHLGWYYVSVRIGFFLWVALLNLITISSTWARVIDVMDAESGSRLFGFVGAGATFGQLFGSVFAAGTAWLGPFSLLFAAILMELAAQAAKGINQDVTHESEELLSLRESVPDQEVVADGKTRTSCPASSPKSTFSEPQLCVMLDGLCLILSSTYLLYVSLFLCLSAVISSFFYFQKVTVIAMNVASPAGIRKILAQINSFIVIFILIGQLTLTVCIDVIIQRLGDAMAAGAYKLLFGTLNGRTSVVSLFALPVCLLWMITAFHLGRHQAYLAKLQTTSASSISHLSRR